MVFKYNTKDHILYDVPPKSGVLVFDVSTQGVMEFNELKIIKDTFPEVYQTYIALCLDKDTQPGTAYVIEFREYKIGLLFTREKYKEHALTLVEDTIDAVHDLFNLIDINDEVYSCCILKRDGQWSHLLSRMKNEFKDKDIKWTMLSKGDVI
jgi:hypothetical protein